MHDYYILSKQKIDRELAARRWRNVQYAQDILYNENAQPRGLRILFRRLFDWLVSLRPRHRVRERQPERNPPCGKMPLADA